MLRTGPCGDSAGNAAGPHDDGARQGVAGWSCSMDPSLDRAPPLTLTPLPPSSWTPRTYSSHPSPPRCLFVLSSFQDHQIRALSRGSLEANSQEATFSSAAGPGPLDGIERP